MLYLLQYIGFTENSAELFRTLSGAFIPASESLSPKYIFLSGSLFRIVLFEDITHCGVYDIQSISPLLHNITKEILS